MKQPASYIREAVRDIGLVVRSVTVTDYRPDFFGNLVANVDTDLGPLVIVYDRAFYVNSAAAFADKALCARLNEALEYRRELAFGCSADDA